jgi:hypothetical protein
VHLVWVVRRVTYLQAKYIRTFYGDDALDDVAVRKAAISDGKLCTSMAGLVAGAMASNPRRRFSLCETAERRRTHTRSANDGGGEGRGRPCRPQPTTPKPFQPLRLRAQGCRANTSLLLAVAATSSSFLV